MLTPVSALGSEYVGAPHGQREPDDASDVRVFHIYGAGRRRHSWTYEPANLGAGQLVAKGGMVEIRTSGAFVVRSQDADHPFAVFTYMSGAGNPDNTDSGWTGAWGDAEFVRVVPPPQSSIPHYVFFTDPTYPFTTLTVTRKTVDHRRVRRRDPRLPGGRFPRATSGTRSARRAITRSRSRSSSIIGPARSGRATTACTSWIRRTSSECLGVGLHQAATTPSTGWVSYGYPAGENVQPINNVVIERCSAFTAESSRSRGSSIAARRLGSRPRDSHTPIHC